MATTQYTLVCLTGVSGCTNTATEREKKLLVVFFHFLLLLISLCVLCVVLLPVVYGQLLSGDDSQFDVLQARRKRGLLEGHCDFLLVAVNVFHSSYRTRKHKA